MNWWYWYVVLVVLLVLLVAGCTPYYLHQEYTYCIDAGGSIQVSVRGDNHDIGCKL